MTISMGSLTLAEEILNQEANKLRVLRELFSVTDMEDFFNHADAVKISQGFYQILDGVIEGLDFLMDRLTEQSRPEPEGRKIDEAVRQERERIGKLIDDYLTGRETENGIHGEYARVEPIGWIKKVGDYMEANRESILSARNEPEQIRLYFDLLHTIQARIEAARENQRIKAAPSPAEVVAEIEAVHMALTEDTFPHWKAEIQTLIESWITGKSNTWAELHEGRTTEWLNAVYAELLNNQRIYLATFKEPEQIGRYYELYHGIMAIIEAEAEETAA